ncbi:MAG: acyl-CoA dehydrogenase family protein [Thermodesulfobacteriota bacterium]|nr:acyl-CoA dehydrogenase family protein [Thermodesulfobacteriota bacterium]
MDFALTEEQQLVRDMVRRFAEAEIKPKAAELDERHEHPADILTKLGELKMMGVAVPEEYGGGGMDHVSYALSVIEISRACASTGAIVSVNNSLYCFPLLKWGTDSQKKKYLYPCASGEKLGCFGLTEAGAGSDAAGIHTTALGDGDGYIINGEKKFITNGNVSSYCVLAAHLTEKEEGYKGISCFVVDLEKTPGFKVGRVENKLGILASGTAELIFDDARVPRDALVGNMGDGIKIMLTTLDGGRVGIASQAIGIGRAVLEDALEYVKTREQFGRAISAFQAIQWKLADMATELDAAELITLRAAWLDDQEKPFEKAAAMAKMYASDAAMRASIEGVQILGGYGYCKDYPMERYMRDAKICQIYEGTNEIMRLIIARELLRRG